MFVYRYLDGVGAILNHYFFNIVLTPDSLYIDIDYHDSNTKPLFYVFVFLVNYAYKHILKLFFK